MSSRALVQCHTVNKKDLQWFHQNSCSAGSSSIAVYCYLCPTLMCSFLKIGFGNDGGEPSNCLLSLRPKWILKRSDQIRDPPFLGRLAFGDTNQECVCACACVWVCVCVHVCVLERPNIMRYLNALRCERLITRLDYTYINIKCVYTPIRCRTRSNCHLATLIEIRTKLQRLDSRSQQKSYSNFKFRRTQTNNEIVFATC